MPIPTNALDIYAAMAKDFPEAGALSTLDKNSMLEVFQRLEGSSEAILGVDVLRFDELGRPGLDCHEMWYLNAESQRLYSSAEWLALCIRALEEARRFVESTPDSPAEPARFIAQIVSLAEYEANMTRPQKRFGSRKDMGKT